jgi:ribosomal protein S12 methylthiotransferase accessory factor
MLHALYEIVERDAIAGLPPDSLGQPVDQGTIDDEGCLELIDRIRTANVALTLCRVPSRFGVPCFAAQVWSPDFPIRCRGHGAHLDPAVAASRAVTEAVQSRLTAIAGSRDDLPSIYGHVQLGRSAPPDTPHDGRPWHDVERSARSFTDVAEELAWVAVTVRDGCHGREPLVIDLSTDADFAVVRVIVPGAELDLDHMHPEQ